MNEESEVERLGAYGREPDVAADGAEPTKQCLATEGRDLGVNVNPDRCQARPTPPPLPGRRGLTGLGVGSPSPVRSGACACSASARSARLSSGEYVVKADTVAQQPRAYWDNLNAGRFAAGGYVGGGSSGGGGASTVNLAGATVVVRVGEREFTGYVSEVADGRVTQALAGQASKILARPRR
jgi:hypothetical protein